MNNILKKYLSLLLALVLTMSLVSLPAFSEDADNVTDGETEAFDEMTEDGTEEDGGEAEGEEPEYPDELKVGHTTITNGDFFTEMFGNNTADIDVRALIHGYNLVDWDQNQGVYVIDESVVENTVVAEDELGNRTYILELFDDLYYSDGTPITAWDYAFSLLLMMSPEIEQIGGKIYRAEHIMGYKEYISGELPYLAGVGVLDDYQLAITLDHEFLPYFFETGLLLTVPYPISVIAPGCRVYAGQYVDIGDGYGYGISIGNADQSAREPVYTAELLKETILDPDTGYNSHPSVVSGPYRLVDYDYKTARFEINEYYKGAWMYSTLPDNYNYEVLPYAGVGSGTVALNNHEGPNVYALTKVNTAGEEYSIYLVKPTIERISFSLADNNTMAEDLRNGTFNLLNKTVYGPAILELMGTGQGTAETDADEEEEGEEEADPAEEEEIEENSIRYQNYPRIGLAFLTFTYERPAVHEAEVRQAMAWCMDREQLTQDYCSGFGLVVDGYYGIEQWEYLICSGQLEYPINMASDLELSAADLQNLQKYTNMYASSDEEYDRLVEEWEKLKLDNLVHYGVYDVESDPERTDPVGITRANELLDKAGWTLNRDGGEYDPEKDDVRCKMVDGELVALDLTLMYPRGNHIVDTISENFLDNLAQAGIKVTLVPEEMETLLRRYYREEERTTDMIYLATNFHVVVDPSITYSTDDTPGHLIWNNTYSDDEELWELAVDMRRTEPGDVYSYVAKWIRFQERYNEVLPAIPVYSNIYFDFYTSQLQNYSITSHVTWTQAILSSYFGEEPVVEEEVTEDEEDGLEDFED